VDLVELLLGVLGSGLAFEHGLDPRVEGVQLGVGLVPLPLLFAGEAAVLLGGPVGEFLGLLPHVRTAVAQSVDKLRHDTSPRKEECGMVAMPVPR
jgi:hypothetical protein